MAQVEVPGTKIGIGHGGGGGNTNSAVLKQIGLANDGSPVGLGGSLDSVGEPVIDSGPTGVPGLFDHMSLKTADGVKNAYNHNIDQENQYSGFGQGPEYILYGPTGFGGIPSPITNNVRLSHFLDEFEGENNTYTPLTHRRTTHPGGSQATGPGFGGFQEMGTGDIGTGGPKVPLIGAGQSLDVDKTPPYSISKIMGNVPTDPHVVAGQGVKIGADVGNQGGSGVQSPFDNLQYNIGAK